jgi:hypothetical protein
MPVPSPALTHCFFQKFAARKARKFHDQGNRLALPVLELAYVFLAIAHAPREIMSSKMIPAIETVLVKLMALESDQSRHESWRGYWDDYCLTKFLEGVCWRYMAHPACIIKIISELLRSCMMVAGSGCCPRSRGGRPYDTGGCGRTSHGCL